MNAKMIVPSAKTLLSAAGSAAAAAMLLRSVAREYIPQELRFFVLSKLRSLLSSITFQLTLIVDEYDALSHNHLFRAAELYLQPSLSPATNRFRATMPKKEEKISLTMERNEEIVDTFRGVHFRWRFVSKPIASKYVQAPGQETYSLYKSELRHFELRFHKRHKSLALDLYLPHVIQQSKRFEEEKKTLKIFTLRHDRLRGRRGDSWQSVVLDHPATFETVAMEAEMKKMVVEDLERFVKRREMYRRVGKAWKRGYLLFGPPGTGKSSLIAAMANYLNFDVYDLELTDIRKNSDLRKLLIATANRSILVVEDIDCSLELRDRDRLAEVENFYPYHFTSGTEVTLSGFLNFIDGLWSSCGDERIIVFTTNHKEKLDPALLRPGRMDVHIHMSYCTPSGFKVLASNYLGVTHHSLFSVIEEFIATMKVTPAEIGEHLMKSDEPEIALRGLIEFLEGKRMSDNEIRVKEAKSEQEDEKKDERNNHCEEGIQNMIEIGVEASKSKC